jgi:type I restriction enzyme, S subunit
MKKSHREWQYSTINDTFIKIKNGASIKQTDGLTGIPITRIETISKSEINLNKLGYADITDDQYLDYYLENGDILMSHINSMSHLGKSAIVENLDCKIIHGMNLLLLKADREKIHPKFANYYFETEEFRKQLLQISNQSVNQASFSSGKLKNLQIPLPPLPTQKRITEILDAADALRRNDQALLKKYDELAQAIFIDMFGDPLKNEKGWEVKKLGEILDVDAKAVNPKMLESYNYVGLEHIEKETGKILTIDKGEVLSNKFIFNENHILYGKLRPYLNKVATPDFKGICSTDIFPLKPKKSFLKQFLVSILRSKDFVNHSNTNAVGANLPRANKDIILNYKTIIPNEKIVELFSKNIVSIEFQKLVIEKQIQNSESLFNSLIQKAFNGELVG